MHVRIHDGFMPGFMDRARSMQWMLMILGECTELTVWVCVGTSFSDADVCD